MASREQNETKFGRWEELQGGGRRYTRDTGRAGGRARYIKEVDANEVTTHFAQEIFNREGILVAVHQKFPVDLEHRTL